MEASAQSALNLVVLINSDTAQGFKLFGSSDEAKRIAGGNDKLPKALAQAIQSVHPIEFEHRLLAVQDNGLDLRLVFDRLGKTIELFTKKLILTLPVALLKDMGYQNDQFFDQLGRA